MHIKNGPLLIDDSILMVRLTDQDGKLGYYGNQLHL